MIVWLQMEGRKRDLAMFNLAIDSKLRGYDHVRLKIDDVWVEVQCDLATARRPSGPESAQPRQKYLAVDLPSRLHQSVCKHANAC
jgi:hypothetical protein